jgi:hypothetical protein
LILGRKAIDVFGKEMARQLLDSLPICKYRESLREVKSLSQLGKSKGKFQAQLYLAQMLHLLAFQATCAWCRVIRRRRTLPGPFLDTLSDNLALGGIGSN